MIKKWCRWLEGWRQPEKAKQFCAQARSEGKSPVLIARFEALGDVVWATTLVRHFAANHPECAVAFMTQPRHLPLVTHLEAVDAILVLENDTSPQFSRVRAYFDQVYILSQETADRPRHIFHDYCHPMGLPFVEENPILKKRFKKDANALKLVIHLGPTWAVRSIEASIVDDALKALLDHNLKTVQVGKHDSHERLKAIELCHAHNKMNQQSLMGLVEEIATADIFLGVDSGPMHIASAASIPIVGLFSSVLPETRLPFNIPCIAVQSEVDCLGCHHQVPRRHTGETCPNAVCCRESFCAEAIANGIEELIAVVKNET